MRLAVKKLKKNSIFAIGLLGLYTSYNLDLAECGVEKGPNVCDMGIFMKN